MPKLTDKEIRAWIKSGERFEGKADGNGLYLCYRKTYKHPVWRFRYKFAGLARVMILGSYIDLSLSKARELTKELSARVSLGYDVASEKQERKAKALAKIEADKNAIKVSDLAAEYFERQILPRWKHPDILRRRIDKDINPRIGHMKIEDVKPRHIDEMLKSIVDRGAPTMATDVLRWLRRMFDYAIKRQIIEINPCSAFEVADAGGKEISRDRWLTNDELISFFKALRTAGISRQNEISFKILLALGLRKMELCAARWEEFDFSNTVWHFPAERSKNGDAIDIPLCPTVIKWFMELKSMACGSQYVLPARKMQNRMIPHIQESTLPVALSKVRYVLPKDIPNFTIHDFRRTMRTHLAKLGIDPFVAERCLNHRIRGVEGIYNRHDYFDERKKALEEWCNLLVKLDK
ncbi:tyrosine-type recombinase/integrase [Providencia rettgeri]|uniref:tyrosine-type recombinase/integrase n=1 Tax=Providencia rettgeri TaxID=587 RepID=UPI001B3763BE|nr:site-specific integrase [Providencia rettgeri]EHZ7765094.1 tyrosine-type recombinase/integrase [Providencia rettgeri]EIJ7168236.1 tyrosine-type recombinase/integrase [Providencia rettgeri]ELR5092936.1 tyrosine-type recombinase/integrase [Providencia rettgeri]ELR5105416.1 tyrosine-type recombinase/integrase [Providencia rettgeri]MBQ0608483.1 tyrosine-type recombinase/integrase [Providencia rettgeri]